MPLPNQKVTYERGGAWHRAHKGFIRMFTILGRGTAVAVHPDARFGQFDR
jgi:hypothetical protein